MNAYRRWASKEDLVQTRDARPPHRTPTAPHAGRGSGLRTGGTGNVFIYLCPSSQQSLCVCTMPR